MGYMRHNCIVVTGRDWNDAVGDAHKKAGALFGSLVSPIILSTINGYMSFYVAPDGSKEGWAESDSGDECRSELIKYLRDTPLDWAEVQYGDDNNITKVIQHSDEATP